MKRGGPRAWYADNVKEESELSLVQAYRVAQDRAEWRSMTKKPRQLKHELSVIDDDDDALGSKSKSNC